MRRGFRGSIRPVHFSASVAALGYGDCFPHAATQGASMLNLIIAFVIGLFIGATFGFFSAVLMVGAHNADEHMRALRRE